MVVVMPSCTLEKIQPLLEIHTCKESDQDFQPNLINASVLGGSAVLQKDNFQGVDSQY